jgi:hypothetical protein
VDLAGKCQGVLHCGSLAAFDGHDAVLGALLLVVVIVVILVVRRR